MSHFLKKIRFFVFIHYSTLRLYSQWYVDVDWVNVMQTHSVVAFSMHECIYVDKYIIFQPKPTPIQIFIVRILESF